MSISMKISAAALIAGTLLFGAPAVVAQAGAKPDPRLATYKANDKNKDGKLAKAEFNVVGRSYGFGPQADAIFAQSDKNKDTFLQEAEFLVALDAGNKATAQIVTAAPPVAPASAGNAAATSAAFKVADKNKDGKLTKAEFTDSMKGAPPGMIETVWASVDKNKDGSATAVEYAAGALPPMSADAMKAMMTEAFATNDKNKDGKLTKAELTGVVMATGGDASDVEKAMKDLDKNADTFVSKAEFDAVLTGSRDSMASGGAPVGVGAAVPSPDQRTAAFKASDKNKDGKLTKTEYTEVLKILGYSDQLEAYWAQRDVNKDGFITEAEYAPAIAGGTAIPVTAPKQ